MDATQIFSSIPSSDPLALFDGGKPTQAIVDFLNLKQRDVARAAKVSQHSVRYDLRMPDILQDWLRQVGTTISLVYEFFNDAHKTELWFATPNPMLGSIAPIDMIKMGRVRKLLAFVQTALDENKR